MWQITATTASSHLQEVDNLIGNGIDPDHSDGKAQPCKYLEDQMTTESVREILRVKLRVKGKKFEGDKNQ